MWMLDSVIFLPSAGTDTRLLKTPPLRHTVVCCTHFTALAHLSFLLLAAPLHMQAKWLRCPHLGHLLLVAGHVFLLTCAPFPHLVNDGQACDFEGSAVGLLPLFLMLNRWRANSFQFWTVVLLLVLHHVTAFTCYLKSLNCFPYWFQFSIFHNGFIPKLNVAVLTTVIMMIALSIAMGKSKWSACSLHIVWLVSASSGTFVWSLLPI